MKYISSENDENMLRDINLSAEFRQAEAEQRKFVNKPNIPIYLHFIDDLNLL
jgi:hypothetical protein